MNRQGGARDSSTGGGSASNEDGTSDDFSPGEEVKLLVGESVVGTASCLPAPGDEMKISQRLHGKELSLLETDGECFVVLRRIKIAADCGDVLYPYPCPGPEDAPDTLGELFSTGLYAWDARKLRRADT